MRNSEKNNWGTRRKWWINFYTYIYSKMVRVEKALFNIHETDGTEERAQELSELIKLRELFEYTYEIKDESWDIESILRWFPQEELGLFIKMLEIYKRNLIEDSFRAYPMNVDALNNRNWSITVIGELIKYMSKFRHKVQDMEYRDDGTLREDLKKANEKLKENPLDSIK